MNQQDCASRAMPGYQSHKKVWALKIEKIEFDRDLDHNKGYETDGSATITPVEDGYAPFEVDHAYVSKHDPKAGGYYVVYDDGYKSWSPAEAFEAGYTLIEDVVAESFDKVLKMNPTIGRIVHYGLTEDDCAVIRGQRRMTSSGRSGNSTNPGEVVPMIIVKVWPNSVNGQALLDGNDSLWVTSVDEGVARGQWHWPQLT